PARPASPLRSRRQAAPGSRPRGGWPTTHAPPPGRRKGAPRQQAHALVSFHDVMALENREIRRLVQHRRLAKALSQAGWARFHWWVEHSGQVQGVPVLAVPPHSTSQLGAGCGPLVRTLLSVRTPICPHCGLILDRDHHAALLIREAGGWPWRSRRGSATPTTQRMLPHPSARGVVVP